MQIHTTNIISLTAKVAATGLCLASAAFGAVFAASVGVKHSIALAVITVLFVVCLELVKPLALVAGFDAFKNWSPIRGLALGALALVAIAYSLTAELALTASSRSDLAASRQADSDAAKRAQERHQRASSELATLKPSRTVGEVEATIARQSANGCSSGGLNGKWVCPVNASLLGELARAKRRQELEAVLNGADQALAGPTAKVADPGSFALATYLSAVGLEVKPETVAQWLTLVPVVALELGSALAGLLVQAVSHPKVEPPKARDATKKDRVATAIVDHLKANGGAVRGSHRVLGAKLGANRNTINRALHSLAASGVVALSSSKAGSMLRLVA